MPHEFRTKFYIDLIVRGTNERVNFSTEIGSSWTLSNEKRTVMYNNKTYFFPLYTLNKYGKYQKNTSHPVFADWELKADIVEDNWGNNVIDEEEEESEHEESDNEGLCKDCDMEYCECDE
jgi:hypothetical protein